MAARKLEQFRSAVGNSGAFERFTGYRDAAGKIVMHGPYEFVSRDGAVLERCQHKDGLVDGTRVAYHDNGKKRSEAHYRAGEYDGQLKMWYETGVLSFECQYQANSICGISRRYHENGKLEEEATYENGLKNGPCKVWDEGGTLIADGVYKSAIPFEGTFVFEEAADDPYTDFVEYIWNEHWRRRTIKIIEFRSGVPTASNDGKV